MPKDSFVFEKMASGLNDEEREQLLEKIRVSSKSGDEPLYIEPEDDALELEIIYERLGFLQKFLLFIRALFTQKDPIDFLEDISVDRLAKEAAGLYPGLFNAKTKCFESAFAFELRTLKTRVAVLGEQLLTAENNRRDFLTFLAGIEFPSLHSQLHNASDPVFYARFAESGNWVEIKRRMLTEIRQILEELGEQDRDLMYQHTRSIKLLSDLVFFPYSKILTYFEGPDSTVAMSNIKESFIELGDILASMSSPPKGTLLKALILFHNKSELDDPALEENEEILNQYKVNANSTTQIRTFNHKIPMMKLLKIAKRDIGYRPAIRSGGEDWYALLRSYWEDRISHNIEIASFEDNKKSLFEQFSKIVTNPRIAIFKNYRDDILENDQFCRLDATAEVIIVFLEKAFIPELSKHLKFFLVEGDFYKPQNREEFTNSTKYLEQVSGDLRSVDQEIEPGYISEQIENKFQKLVIAAQNNLRALVNVLKGILYGESGGRYDTLVNISSIGGRENQLFLDRLAKDLLKYEQILTLWESMYELERTSKHAASEISLNTNRPAPS